MRRSRRAFALVLCLAGTSVALPPGGAPAEAFARYPTGPALPRGAAMVVVAPARPTADDLESEAYGDWAEYLNAFAATRPGRLPVVRMTAARWRKLARRPALTDSYATVFLRADGGALVHQGMVLEPQVYQAGAAWATGGAAPDMAAHGFSAGRLIRVP